METKRETIDIVKSVREIQDMYVEVESRGFLLIGPTGSGKSHMIATAPRPIHIDSFDPSGTDISIVRKGREEGWIIVDNRFEKEDPTNPEVFELWDEVYHERKKSGYFDYFQTYALDSMTTWAEAAMNYLLYGAPKDKKKMPGYKGRKSDRDDKTTAYLAIPQENDYPLQMTIIRNAIGDILALPCPYKVICGHLEDKTDNQGRLIGRGLYVTGKLRIRLPRLFSEVYILETKDTSAGPQRRVLTQPDGMKEAKSGIGGERFDKWEEPDICKLLDKAGLGYIHKATPWMEEEDGTSNEHVGNELSVGSDGTY